MAAAILGLMQRRPLLVSMILTHAARHHGDSELVSRDEGQALQRFTYREVERRTRRLADALGRLGVRQGDRVASLAWNSHRHLELYYAVSGMGAVMHTVNPRLSAEDIGYILDHAGTTVLFADPAFLSLLDQVLPGRQALRHVFVMSEALPAERAGGWRLGAYEALLASGEETFDWPDLDENAASALCYTSGTTGRPKGVLYSHRGTVLHAYAAALPDAFGLGAADRVMPVVPMFHVNAWGLPYSSLLVGASLVMPGRHLDGESLLNLMNQERVTFTAGVPTVWLGLLQHLRATGQRPATLKRLVIGGSAMPQMLRDAFADEYGIDVRHAWGMSEMSPLGSVYAPKPSAPEPARAYSQGRALPGVDMRIVDDQRRPLPWDGVTNGNLETRGLWVIDRYFGIDQPAVDEQGWFATGDVAVIDPQGYMTITDRTKDIVKSGGEWISSIQLENIAVAHPDVAEAAIIAIPDPKWAERPLLVLLPKPGRVLDPASVLALYEGKVAKWWIPEEVVVVEEMPHTATGKLNKLALRQRFPGHAPAQ